MECGFLPGLPGQESAGCLALAFWRHRVAAAPPLKRSGAPLAVSWLLMALWALPCALAVRGGNTGLLGFFLLLATSAPGGLSPRLFFASISVSRGPETAGSSEVAGIEL